MTAAKESTSQIAAEIVSEVEEALRKDFSDVSWNDAYSTSAKRLCVRNCDGLVMLSAEALDPKSHSDMTAQ